MPPRTEKPITFGVADSIYRMSGKLPRKSPWQRGLLVLVGFSYFMLLLFLTVGAALIKAGSA